MAEFRQKMNMGKKKEAVLALCEFHQQYSGCHDQEMITALREFIVLNPFPKHPGNIEAVNLLQKIDHDFARKGMGALYDQVALLSMAAQSAPEAFDLGGYISNPD